MPEDIANFLPPSRVWAMGAARPVLALHCSLAHAGAWSGLAQGLSGVTLTAIDQPGHGRAADLDPACDLHTIAAREAIAMAEELGQGAPIDIFGHSFGGTLALRVALERPDLVRSLMLVEPVIFAAARAAESPVWAPFRASHAVFEDMIRAGQLSEAAEMFHAAWGNEVRFADLPAQTRAYMTARISMILAQAPMLFEDAAGLLRYMGLEAIGVPVLLVEGAQSPAVIDAVNTELARRLGKAHRHVVAGATHMVPITHAAVLAPVVQAHLDGC